MPSGCNVSNCNKRFRPFCLCPPDVMFLTRRSKNSLFFVFHSLSNLDCGQWCKFWIYQSHPMSAPATQKVAMEYLCVLQLETALATLVTTWFTLADRRWGSRYHSSDQCILNAFRSPERYNGWFKEQLGQRCTFFNFCSIMTDDDCNFL